MKEKDSSNKIIIIIKVVKMHRETSTGFSMSKCYQSKNTKLRYEKKDFITQKWLEIKVNIFCE